MELTVYGPSTGIRRHSGSIRATPNLVMYALWTPITISLALLALAFLVAMAYVAVEPQE
jgi:hypothetical protein